MQINDKITLISKYVQQRYKKLRTSGYSRDTAIAMTCEEHSCELSDDDDRIAVLGGLVLALSKKKELTKPIADDTYVEIQNIKQSGECDWYFNKYLSKIEEMLKDADIYGDEASYERASVYIPDWQIGDTFSHILTCPRAKELGIMGWHILLYKVGEYVDDCNVHHQLMCVSLCSPDNIPSCYDDLKKLGFLPMMGYRTEYEYLAQIGLKSQKAENDYELTKIGNFDTSDDPFLDRVRKEHQLTAMPLFGKLRRNDLLPDYEDQICSLYKLFLNK